MRGRLKIPMRDAMKFVVERSAETKQEALRWSTWRVNNQATFTSLHQMQ